MLLLSPITMNDKNLPKFDAPPIIETVLSVQFKQLPIFSNAHTGWFWKNYLGSEWDQITEAPRLEDQFERFGEEKWKKSGLGFILQTHPGLGRTQIVRSDTQRMIQVQNTRFIQNWRKTTASNYPSYDDLLPEFIDNFQKFSKFSKDSGNPDLELNQWEVTYVNHIEKGDLWTNVQDWEKLFPDFGVMSTGRPDLILDNFGGTWRFACGTKAKLYIEMKQVKIGGEHGPTGPELILLQLISRGPVVEGADFIEGFNLGHELIVTTFANITADIGHKYWNRRS